MVYSLVGVGILSLRDILFSNDTYALVVESGHAAPDSRSDICRVANGIPSSVYRNGIPCNVTVETYGCCDMSRILQQYRVESGEILDERGE